MDTHYPHHHSHLYHGPGHAGPRHSAQPVCAYCLHLLGAAPPGTIITVSMQRELEKGHHCLEKTLARSPEVALPYN